jgi:hypothetical protein
MRASNVRARRSAPVERGGRSAGLGRWVSRHTLSGVLHLWTRAGDHRFPDDPSYAFALLHDPGRAARTSPLVVLPMPPPASKNRRPQRKIISRLTQGFSIRCLRFKSSVAVAPARLASGRRAAPLPGGGRTLWTAAKSFRSFHLPLSRTSHVAIRFYPLSCSPLQAAGAEIFCLSFKLFSVAAAGQGRRHDRETTVDHALMRGLVTAGPVMRRGASSV